MPDRVRSGVVGALVTLAIVFFIVYAVIALAKNVTPGGQVGKLMANGIPARGILLMVAPTGTRTGVAPRQYEIRQVRIDIEIPGREPYETTASPAIPVNLVRDVLPGATVEVRVDPKNPSNIAIVGPGTGFVQQGLRTA